MVTPPHLRINPTPSFHGDPRPANKTLRSRRTSLTWLRALGAERQEGRAGMGHQGGKWRGAVPKGGARTKRAPGSATSGDAADGAPGGQSLTVPGPRDRGCAKVPDP